LEKVTLSAAAADPAASANPIPAAVQQADQRNAPTIAVLSSLPGKQFTQAPFNQAVTRARPSPGNDLVIICPASTARTSPHSVSIVLSRKPNAAEDRRPMDEYFPQPEPFVQAPTANSPIQDCSSYFA
jgi:hypothetical protein